LPHKRQHAPHRSRNEDDRSDQLHTLSDGSVCSAPKLTYTQKLSLAGYLDGSEIFVACVVSQQTREHVVRIYTHDRSRL
jgi:hypothetical protein